MQTVFYKLAIIFLFVFVGFEVIFGLVIPHMVLKSRDSYINRWRKLYNETENAEMVCLGSSRVHRHCNPDVLTANTHLTTEVIASPGAKIDAFEKLYDDYLLKNKRPKVLLVGIDLTGLDSTAFLPFPENFFPFMNTSTHISEMKEYDYIKYHKPLGYFYFKELYLDMIEYPEKKPHVHGFLGRDIKWDSALGELIHQFPHGLVLQVYRPTLIKIFQFMERERKAGVQCIGFISPEFHLVWKYEINRALALREIYTFSDSTKIPVWNFSDSSYKKCFDQDLFYNSQHLNKKGSELFSKDLADSILKYCSLNK